MTDFADGLPRREAVPHTRAVAVETTFPSWLARYPRRTRSFVRAHESRARFAHLIMVLVTAPLWLGLLTFIALLTKLQDPSAPVLFRQARTGRNGHRFDLLKFRTMVKDAEAMKKDLLHLNELEWPDFKISNDPRITRLGRVLRATSLDELPQLFNVVKGDMALVGPRPTSFGIETYDLWHTARVEMCPGMTGLWQVTARANLDWDQRVRLELAYQQRASALLDLEILFRTIGAVFNRSGN